MPYLRNAFSRLLSQIFPRSLPRPASAENFIFPVQHFLAAPRQVRTAMQFIRRPRPGTRDHSPENAQLALLHLLQRGRYHLRGVGLLRTRATPLPHDMLKVHGGEKRKEKPREHGRWSARNFRFRVRSVLPTIARSRLRPD